MPPLIYITYTELNVLHLLNSEAPPPPTWGKSKILIRTINLEMEDSQSPKKQKT